MIKGFLSLGILLAAVSNSAPPSNECLRRDPMRRWVEQTGEKPLVCFVAQDQVTEPELQLLLKAAAEWNACGYSEVRIYRQSKWFKTLQGGTPVTIVDADHPVIQPDEDTPECPKKTCILFGFVKRTPLEVDDRGYAVDYEMVLRRGVPIAYNVMLHEMGHRLGVPHTEDTIMQAGTDYSDIYTEMPNKLTSEDCNLIKPGPEFQKNRW